MQELHRLRDLGVRIVMDDFGTGYASLGYLPSFPFSKIKLDRTFVTGSVDNADGRVILRAVAGLGASLGIETVAPGVEEAAELEQVRNAGYSQVQGFSFSKPAPIDQVMDGVAEVRHPVAEPVTIMVAE